jgi:3-oxoacyl-[acyl-carrier protein] reductase
MNAHEGCALVTGGSRGIGAATCARLAADGWPVAVVYRSDEAAATAVVDEITDAGGRALAICADVCEPGAAESAFTAAEAELGPVLVLVNNAGITDDGLAPQLEDDAWDRVLQTNLTGAFRFTRRALGPMLRARRGRIVNVASIVGLVSNPGQANYAAAKAGLVGMTKTVAVEVARRGITVNAVAPGFIATDLTEELPAGVASRIPARRVGTPGDVAGCIAFLASADAAYVTGQTLVVDGGLIA